jgi:hypothetical protein
VGEDDVQEEPSEKDKAIRRALESANGEAMYASLVLTTLIEVLIQNGALSREQVVHVADSAALILEKHRATIPNAAGTVDHARTRLEQLLKSHSTKLQKDGG